MESYLFEGVVTALTSVSHIGETFGINARLRREKIVMADGSVEEIPVISGNSLRGTLRDRGMLHMCRALGYGVDEETGEVRGLSLPAFYFLFSGGSLTSTADRGLDLDAARELRHLIPLVSVFGGAMGNQIMPGKLSIGKLYPICRETLHLIPTRFHLDRHESIWEMVQEEAYTRKDDEKDERLRPLIAPEVRHALEDQARKKRAVRGTEEDVERETGQHQQMRYYVETLCAGTRFYWMLALEDVDRVEFEAFLICLQEFAKRPYIGGKSAIGHGRIAVEFDRWVRIDPRVQVQGQPIDLPLGERYRAHLQEHGPRIRELLHALG